MKPNVLLSVYAVLAAVFCGGLLFVPGFWIALYGGTVDPQAIALLRLVGALFGGLAVMAWAGRNAPPSQSRDAMLLGFLVLNGLSAFVAVLIALSGVYNAFAWGPVACWGLFTVAFAVSWRDTRTPSITAPSRSAAL